MKTQPSSVFYILFLSAFILHPSALISQVPVTVNRSIVNSQGTVVLPTYSGGFSFNPQVQTPTMNFTGGVVSGPIGNNWASVSGSVVASPGTIPGNTASIITLTVTPNVIIATDAPSVFTNSISAAGNYNGGGIDRTTPQASQTYIVTMIDDTGSGGGGGPTPTASLSGQGDSLESISRKDPSITLRKLLEFQLKATTTAVLNSIAFSVSNTTTNRADFLNLALYQDANANEEFDLSDTLIATATNATGFAVFSGLTNLITTNHQTFFLAASFDPTYQTQNSFIGSTLRDQNVVVTRADTNLVIQVTGGTVVGKQYAFLDTTTSEDIAAAAALSNQINSAVNSATNALSSSYTTQLSDATNALTASYTDQLAHATKGLGVSTTVLSPSEKKGKLFDSIVPAAAAGVAAIGAAFTSDSLNKTPYSREYSPHQ